MNNICALPGTSALLEKRADPLLNFEYNARVDM